MSHLLALRLFSRPGRSQGLFYKHLHDSLIISFIHHIVKYLYGVFTPKWLKMVLLDILSEILNLEKHQNCCIDSKVMAILMNDWILPNGGVASGRVCILRSRLVFYQHMIQLNLLIYVDSSIFIKTRRLGTSSLPKKIGSIWFSSERGGGSGVDGPQQSKSFDALFWSSN